MVVVPATSQVASKNNGSYYKEVVILYVQSKATGFWRVRLLYIYRLQP